MYINKEYFFETSKLVPYAFSTIMTILPRLIMTRPKIQYIMNRVASNITKEDLIEMVGNTATDMPLTDNDKYLAINRMRDKYGSFMNMISDYQWSKISGNTRLSEIILNSLIYGTGIAYYFWDEENDSPNFEPILPFNFYPDPSCTHTRDLKRCFRRIYLNINDTINMFEMGVYTLPDNITVSPQEYLEGLKTQNQTATDMAGRREEAGTQEPTDIEIIEYYEDDRIVTMIDRKIIVRDVRTSDITGVKSIPFVFSYDYHTPGEFWGLGEVELVEQYVEDATDIRASRKENMLTSMNNSWIVDMTKNVYMEDLVVAPNQIIRMEGQGGVQPLQKPYLSKDSYMEEDVWRRDIIEMSGQAEYFRGSRPDGGVETATAIMSFADTANARWNHKLINLNEYFMIPLGKKWVEMNKKKLESFSMSTDLKDKQNNYILFEVNNKLLKHIKTDYDIKVIAGNNRSTTKEQLNILLQIIFSSEQLQQKINMDKFIPSIFEMFDIPVYDVIYTDEELQQIAQQQAQALQQQVQAQAQMEQERLRGNLRNSVTRGMRNNPEGVTRAGDQVFNNGRLK